MAARRAALLLLLHAATRTFIGTPPPDWNGTIDLRVTASDGPHAAADAFRFTVNPVNDAPTDITGGSLNVDEFAANGTRGRDFCNA